MIIWPEPHYFFPELGCFSAHFLFQTLKSRNMSKTFADLLLAALGNLMTWFPLGFSGPFSRGSRTKRSPGEKNISDMWRQHSLKYRAKNPEHKLFRHCCSVLFCSALLGSVLFGSEVIKNPLRLNQDRLLSQSFRIWFQRQIFSFFLQLEIIYHLYKGKAKHLFFLLLNK